MRLRPALAMLMAIAQVAIGVASQRDLLRIPTGTGSIAGRVIDRSSGHPLAGAMVTLQLTEAAGELKATTDGNGRYVFEGIGPGDYRVTAARDGYVTQEFGREFEIEAFAGGGVIHQGRFVFGLSAGQARDGVNFALNRGGTISGRVTHASGAPVKDAVVGALLVRSGGGFIVNPSEQVRTDDRGEYTIRNIRAGVYQVAVTWIDPEMVKARVGVNRRPIYFPGSTTADEGVPVPVTAGSTTPSINVVLPRQELYRLSGQVLRGSPSGTLEAYLISPSKPARTITLGDDGRFELAYLEVGRYTLWARASLDDQSEGALMTVDLGSDLSELLVPLASTGEISGRVLTDDGDPLVFPGAEVVADLVDDNGRQLDSPVRDRSAIADDGSFHIKGLFGTRVLRLIGTQRQVDRVLNDKTPIDTITFGTGERVEGITIVAVRR